MRKSKNSGQQQTSLDRFLVRDPEKKSDNNEDAGTGSGSRNQSGPSTSTAGASEPAYKNAIKDIHYTHDDKGNYTCGTILRKGCGEMFKGQPNNNKIKGHCRKCFPELREAARLADIETRKRKPDLYKEKNSRAKKLSKQKEAEGQASGLPAPFVCPFIGCGAVLYDSRLYSSHLSDHKKPYRSSALTELIAHKPLPNSQCLDNENEGSQDTNTSSEVRRDENLQKQLNSASRFYYSTYYVLLADPDSRNYPSILDYIRQNQGKPEKELIIYVGKRTSTTKEPDIVTDHGQNRNYSAIVDYCKEGKVAYKLMRRFHKTPEEMELEEAFWLVVADYRKKVADSPTGIQWKFANKKLEDGCRKLSKKNRLFAQALARDNHPLLCVDKECGVTHNLAENEYYGKHHIKEEDIELLDFSEHL